MLHTVSFRLSGTSDLSHANSRQSILFSNPQNYLFLCLISLIFRNDFQVFKQIEPMIWKTNQAIAEYSVR